MNPVRKISILFSIIFLISLNYNLSAQNKCEDQTPSPVGGLVSIAKNVKYPAGAHEAGIEGKVIVKTVVDKNGDVIETSITKSVGHGCDEAAVEAIKKVKFHPGCKDGKFKKMSVQIPVMFKLN